MNFTLALATTVALGPIAAAQTSTADAAAAFGLESADVVQIGLAGLPGAPLTAFVEIDGQLQELVLRPHSVLSDDFELIVQEDVDVYTTKSAGPSNTYRGEIPGMPGAQVAASWLDTGLHALVIEADGGELWIEPLMGRVAGADISEHIVYRSDQLSEGYGQCGVGDDDDHLRIGTDSFATSGSASGPEVAFGSGLLIAELGVDTDFEYFQDYGSEAAVKAQIESVINAMNMQYENEVGITHLITTIIVRTTSSDPYTSNIPSTLLSQFRSHWNASQQAIQRDVAHMFTGRNLSGSVIGVAYLGVICIKNSAYGLVQSDCCGSFASKTDLSAHELGHNWNADHCACQGFTMNSFLTSANKFSPSATIPQMTNYAGNLGCLDQGPGDGCDAVAYGENASPGNIGVFSSIADPSIGTTWQGAFSGFNGFSTGVFISSALQASIPLGEATILIDPSTIFATIPVFSISGSGTVLAPIPDIPALFGLEVQGQVGILDPSFSAGYALSNGITLTLCN